jgi:hypothetical protein
MLILLQPLRLLAKKYCLLVWILEIKVRCLFRYTRTRLDELFSIQGFENTGFDCEV